MTLMIGDSNAKCPMARALTLATMLSLFPFSDSLAEQSAPPAWTGAWRYVDEASDGRNILTESHFCAVFGTKDRKRPGQEPPAEAEAAMLFRSMPGPMCGSLTVLRKTSGKTVLEGVALLTAHPANLGARWTAALRVEGNQMFAELLRDDGTVIVTDTFERISGPGSSRLAGVWRLVSDEWEGFMLTTDTEYRYLMTRKSRPRITGSPVELSDKDAATLYDSYDAQGGGYRVSDSIMTRRSTVARDPRQQGREVQFRFNVVGDMLTTERAGQQLTWRRVE